MANPITEQFFETTEGKLPKSVLDKFESLRALVGKDRRNWTREDYGILIQMDLMEFYDDPAIVQRSWEHIARIWGLSQQGKEERKKEEDLSRLVEDLSMAYRQIQANVTAPAVVKEEGHERIERSE